MSNLSIDTGSQFNRRDLFKRSVATALGGAVGLGTLAGCHSNSDSTELNKTRSALSDIDQKDQLPYFLKELDERLAELSETSETYPEELSGLGVLIPDKIALLSNNLQQQSRTEADLQFITKTTAYSRTAKNDPQISALIKLVLAGNDIEAMQMIHDICKNTPYYNNITGWNSHTSLFESCDKRAVAVAFLKVLIKNPEETKAEAIPKITRRNDVIARLGLS